MSEDAMRPWSEHQQQRGIFDGTTFYIAKAQRFPNNSQAVWSMIKAEGGKLIGEPMHALVTIMLVFPDPEAPLDLVVPSINPGLTFEEIRARRAWDMSTLVYHFARRVYGDGSVDNVREAIRNGGGTKRTRVFSSDWVERMVREGKNRPASGIFDFPQYEVKCSSFENQCNYGRAMLPPTPTSQPFLVSRDGRGRCVQNPSWQYPSPAGYAPPPYSSPLMTNVPPTAPSGSSVPYANQQSPSDRLSRDPPLRNKPLLDRICTDGSPFMQAGEMRPDLAAGPSLALPHEIPVDAATALGFVPSADESALQLNTGHAQTVSTVMETRAPCSTLAQTSEPEPAMQEATPTTPLSPYAHQEISVKFEPIATIRVLRELPDGLDYQKAKRSRITNTSKTSRTTTSPMPHISRAETSPLSDIQSDFCGDEPSAMQQQQPDEDQDMDGTLAPTQSPAVHLTSNANEQATLAEEEGDPLAARQDQCMGETITLRPSSPIAYGPASTERPMTPVSGTSSRAFVGETSPRSAAKSPIPAPNKKEHVLPSSSTPAAGSAAGDNKSALVQQPALNGTSGHTSKVFIGTQGLPLTICTSLCGRYARFLNTMIATSTGGVSVPLPFAMLVLLPLDPHTRPTDPEHIAAVSGLQPWQAVVSDQIVADSIDAGKLLLFSDYAIPRV